MESNEGFMFVSTNRGCFFLLMILVLFEFQTSRGERVMINQHMGTAPSTLDM